MINGGHLIPGNEISLNYLKFEGKLQEKLNQETDPTGNRTRVRWLRRNDVRFRHCGGREILLLFWLRWYFLEGNPWYLSPDTGLCHLLVPTKNVLYTNMFMNAKCRMSGLYFLSSTVLQCSSTTDLILLSSDIRNEGSIANVKKFDFDFFFMILGSTSLPQSKTVF